MIGSDRRSKGRTLALVAAIPVVLIGIYFVIVFPWDPGPSGPPADLDPDQLERWTAMQERRSASLTLWRRPRVRMMPTVLSGLLALAGGLLGRPLLLVIGFVVGWFVPFGMGPYLLLSGWHATWVGASELLYLVAAGMIWREQRDGGVPG